MNFPGYQAFSMRSYFSKQPGQPARCLHCGGPLSVSPVEPSAWVQDELDDPFLIGTHNFSLLFRCKACQWWCIRESWDLNEIGLDLDCLIVGVPSPAASAAQGSEQPWQKALADPSIYRNSEDIPETIAALFPPGKS
ncbi:hypothetical protein [Ornatilinea apprima]|uniref:hypothetical protein n=1 Tax=Ornatilinea apprima TaxID=1134406 RepID=UPI00128F7DF2|nr:hypothetical protein [Ornatilinea apprima]